MLWITRAHVHVDRVACPWLIKRFIDSDAEFLYVAASLVDETVKDTGGIPFDAPGVELGHHDGKCSFEALIGKYELKDPALLRMARIIHCADIDDEIDQDPIARGLEAIAEGYRFQYIEDEENVAMQSGVYDALYAWCKTQK
jgi:hypothetical protein